MTNPLAQSLNNDISQNAPSVFECLSELGKELFFPKGIISQSNEAKEKATKFNATIGIATDNKGPLYFQSAKNLFGDTDPSNIFPYAPTDGRKSLRSLWQKQLFKKNPSLNEKNISLPLVTNGITHAVSIFADLFMDEGDVVLLPDKFWGNYKIPFSIDRKAELKLYAFFNDKNQLDVVDFEKKLTDLATKHKKIVLVLNFPNNPTGYTCTKTEADKMASAIQKVAGSGVKLVIGFDDAYFGLFYDDCLKESMFALLSGLHENIVCVKLDGITKELFFWGARVGFITFGIKSDNYDKVYSALQDKAKGLIRGSLSNMNNHSQFVAEQLLENKETDIYWQECFNTLKDRAAKIFEIHAEGRYDKYWIMYPFNSGYFMCVKLKNGIDAEKLRIHLLDKYQTGVISTSPTDIRVAFSCLELESIEECFDQIAAGCRDLLQ